MKSKERHYRIDGTYDIKIKPKDGGFWVSIYKGPFDTGNYISEFWTAGRTINDAKQAAKVEVFLLKKKG